MSFYVEWERLAEQAYAQIPPDARLPVAEAIIDYLVLFTIDDELDIYLTHIEHVG